jgi:hypothetical protein
MLNDHLLDRSTSDRSDDRRDSERTPAAGEIVLVWHHDAQTPLRFQLVDASDHGLCIRSSMPLRTGMTGTIIRVLPEGSVKNEPVIVAWCAAGVTSEGYDIGLQRFGT